MTRGTTPTLTLRLKKIGDLSGSSLYVTIKQSPNVSLTLTGSELEVAGSTIIATLTQAQTLMFRQGTAKLQVRGVRDGIAWCSKTVAIDINMVLKDGEIA